ncbi:MULTISPECIES: hypothetical protein [Halomicrobium]|uniref:Uncharacterized protein n=2 Tax=Halomicrobium mukohataei TaxID=57705 RepID=C7P031_HALMD|nr:MULTISPECIES: hypothetical protein [Halomicrobium]ACV46939.1 hypothetical protein Hmuk_0808 [Halomicrobium mukohataei DSM 12286]QCD65434.1 hypothetical protein E5139_07205 [Halomicrobium mukohataei]QFR20240.1 hypothetical protein GBQ70_07200 [Halomicrobium sp. ZPS1]
MRDPFHIDSYVILSMVFGIANVVFLLYARWQIDPLEFSNGGLLLHIETAVVLFGHFLLGAVPGYLLLRYRVVSPLVISGYLSWFAYVDQRSMEPFIGLYSSPFIHAFAICVLGGVGFWEYFARERIPFVSHDPLL